MYLAPKIMFEATMLKVQMECERKKEIEKDNKPKTWRDFL